MADRTDWAGRDGLIGAYISEEAEKTLAAYRSQPNLIIEHANHEEDTARGGYARRQLFELVQNGADALSGTNSGRIHIRLTPTHLYCADEGQSIDRDGVRALMFSHLSPKRGTSEIGRFGLGFKSVLGVTDTPEFFSRAGSFRFDRAKAAQLIQPVAPDAVRYPVLRLPQAIDPWPESEKDGILSELMGWSVNIVRLALKLGAHDALAQQVGGFPPEFLLFVEHVSELVLQNDTQGDFRTFSLRCEDDNWLLDAGGTTTRWLLVKDTHRLSSNAKSDSRSLDDAEEVPISWAAPIDRLNDPGRFWAFFPTTTTSLLSGILNAPWKTNEDRQNLLPGVYNDELLYAAAAMVARALPRLSTEDDPARHLDALPRRPEAGDTPHSTRLRTLLETNLQDHEVAPNQDGKLHKLSELSFSPRELPPDEQTGASLRCWAAYDGRPSEWLHHSALTPNRLARLDRLYRPPGRTVPAMLPRASISNWLESLVEEGARADERTAIQTSIAAIQTAALIPNQIRGSNNLGRIVLTANGTWIAPNPDLVFLGGSDTFDVSNLVHPLLQADPETLDALMELGLKPVSPESLFKDMASTMLGYGAAQHQNESRVDERWREFWRLARNVDPSAAITIIRESSRHRRDALRACTVAGTWRSLFAVLLPGRIVPDDGSRDGDIAIDLKFHEDDLPLLEQLGAVSTPCDGSRLSPSRLDSFRESRRNLFTQRDLPRNPQSRMLNFENTTTSGPLDVLEPLSDAGKSHYAWLLLSLDDTYRRWTMSHDTQHEIYPPMEFESPTLAVLREHGRITTYDGIYPLSDAFGDPPKNRAVWRKLLSHPQSDSISRAFRLTAETNARLQPIGEDGPIPLTDAWPGLETYLPAQLADIELIRCDQLFWNDVVRTEVDCVSQDGFVYATRRENEREELELVSRELGLNLSDDQLSKVLLRQTSADIREARIAVSACATDEERLLAAVGETSLRAELPQSLIAILEEAHGTLSGVRVAQAAIATFHTGALRVYRHSLERLDPPRQWAGTQRAVEFVRSLGFGEEWAGDRNTRRDPYIEVDGPYTLPELHDYQRNVVDTIRRLLGAEGGIIGGRRGIVSMPTGSGKTRVAVQAVVEAMREDGFKGGVLWVADRDELCEQAVESWQQVWSSEGAQREQLRISRMWAGQPQPLPISDKHVIVATIQTLSAKIARQPETYGFLADFKLLVFDEAHRSIASTFTSVMQELGLTRLRRASEPFLIGLTATPYRGRDEQETARLVGRYGSNRLDAGAFQSDDPEGVVRELQDMRVLARADHEIIEGGQFSLSSDEELQSRETPWLPRSVENRIASDADRTRRIIKAYDELIDRDWPTLIFATSVEHAQTVAALLSSNGVKARAVSGSTDPASRRRVVEEFRSGDVKALVNYGVFREGFDAPKTRAIIVARPVYSPNLYFQMVGRGLRGVKNGGNDRCLILNVRDNIDKFERKLAFSDLDWLWD